MKPGILKVPGQDGWQIPAGLGGWLTGTDRRPGRRVSSSDHVSDSHQPHLTACAGRRCTAQRVT